MNPTVVSIRLVQGSRPWSPDPPWPPVLGGVLWPAHAHALPSPCASAILYLQRLQWARRRLHSQCLCWLRGRPFAEVGQQVRQRRAAMQQHYCSGLRHGHVLQAQDSSYFRHFANFGGGVTVPNLTTPINKYAAPAPARAERCAYCHTPRTQNAILTRIKWTFLDTPFDMLSCETQYWNSVW
jgi:hypothetical protein